MSSVFKKPKVDNSAQIAAQAAQDAADRAAALAAARATAKERVQALSERRGGRDTPGGGAAAILPTADTLGSTAGGFVPAATVFDELPNLNPV